MEHVPNISLPTWGWGKRINFFWGLSALLKSMQAEDCVLPFCLKYRYVILRILKDLCFSLDTVTWTGKMIEWLWTKDCKKWFCLGSSTQKNYSSWPECGNLLKSFAGQLKQNLHPQTFFFLTVISNMKLAVLFGCDCFKLMHEKGEKCSCCCRAYFLSWYLTKGSMKKMESNNLIIFNK